MEKVIQFDQASRLKDIASVYSQIDDSYLYSHVTPDSDTTLLIDTTPYKLEGTFILLVRSKTPFEVEINMERYTLQRDSFTVLFPGNVMRLVSDVPADLDAYMLYFDLKFLQGVHINMSAVAIPPLIEKPVPVQTLSSSEADLVTRYLQLLYLNTIDETNPVINRSIATSLIAAFFYQMVQFYHRRISGLIDMKDTAKNNLGRRHDYVREFIKLVHLEYVHERSVSYYADKLFIAPKCLSLLVKEATGRSAAKWIDDFVIMEAKSMLRFSNRNIQQVAYALNFPTQSSFGKYFKHLTGMSPTEYQKS